MPSMCCPHRTLCAAPLSTGRVPWRETPGHARNVGRESREGAQTRGGRKMAQTLRPRWESKDSLVSWIYGRGGGKGSCRRCWPLWGAVDDTSIVQCRRKRAKVKRARGMTGKGNGVVAGFFALDKRGLAERGNVSEKRHRLGEVRRELARITAALRYGACGGGLFLCRC